jgi:hypothetical protein
MVDADACMKWFVRILKGMAVVSLCLCIAAYCFIIKVAAGSELPVIEIIFVIAAYIGFIFFCIMLCIAEFEPIWFIKRVYILHFWAGRGFWLLWLGIQLVSSARTLASAVKAESDGDDGGAGAMKVMGQVVGWIMIVVGITFMLMSLMCIRNCTPETDKDRELEAALNGDSSGGSSKDAILAANLAIALGMSPEEARKKFKGSKGAKEANKFAQGNVAQLAKANAMADSANAMAKQQGDQLGAFAKATADSQKAAAQTSVAATSQYMDNAKTTYQPPDAPASGERGGDAGDDLEAAYYKNAQFEH